MLSDLASMIDLSDPAEIEAPENATQAESKHTPF
jgi:hypothetical protein